eukprot:scaffold400185_cov35-Attheya_sp.AAC.1
MSLGSSSSPQREDAFETIACVAWVVMAIADCYIGLILVNGCFLLEWVIVVSCPVAHRRSYRIVVLIPLHSFVSVDRWAGVHSHARSSYGCHGSS